MSYMISRRKWKLQVVGRVRSELTIGLNFSLGNKLVAREVAYPRNFPRGAWQEIETTPIVFEKVF